MKRLAFLAIVLSTTFSSVGCCGWPWPWPCQNGGYGPGFSQPGYYGGGCPSGNCGVQPQMVPGQTGFYQPYDSMQAQAGGGDPGMVAAAVDPATGQPVHRTAMLPLEPLPTYP